jgi:hypothetical protein
MELLEIRGIDFSWPNYAFVDRVAFIRPEIRVEREADGTINLRRMLNPRTGPEPLGGPAPAATTTPAATSAPAAANPPPPAAAATSPVAAAPPAAAEEKAPAPQDKVDKPAATEGTQAKADDKPIRVPDKPATSDDGKPGLMETMVLDFKEIVIEEGYARFVDETLKPTFSEDMSRLAVSIRGLSNATGRRATLTATAIVGGDAALDLRGEMSRLGDDVFADLVGELRDFNLASVSPYTNSFLSWIVQGGKLGVKIHYRVERDQVTGSNEIVISNMAVAPAAAQDEVKRRVGLPLSMIVSLLKDSRGNIDLDLPLSGNWKDRSFDWGEATWAAVKQVIVKVLAAPFRAIGRLFTGGGKEDKVEELSVDPVVFSAGSSVLGPAAEGHLKRVADFLRKSPFVKLALSAVVTARDVESMKGQELTARIQRLQRERGMPDFAAAVRAYFIEQLPTVTPPKTADEQLALLRPREPLPEARLQQLLTRRLSATLETLTRIEGIEAERLQSGPAKPTLDAGGEGRVEFTIAG